MSTTISDPGPAAVTDLDVAIADMMGARPMKVWSVLVTIFGDLTLPDGVALSSTLLGSLAARLGIRAEALRVALHRLRKDGWLTSQRVGRASHYRLSAVGLRESLSVRGRVYPGPTLPEDYSIAIVQAGTANAQTDQERLVQAGFHRLAPGLFVSGLDAGIPAGDALVLPGGSRVLPAWMRQHIGNEDLAAEYKTLSAQLDRLEALLQQDRADWTVLDQSVVRILIVHLWRRLALRHPDLPARCFPNQWPGLECRAKVCSLLCRVTRPDLYELEQLAVRGG